MALRYADEITGDRVANFYIGREWHEVIAPETTYDGAQCEDCGENDLTVHWDHLSGLITTLTCSCGASYIEIIDRAEDARRALGHILENPA